MQKRSEATQSRILQEASRLFAENGYDATGVSEICRAAGISKGAFYHHFPTKQAVFLVLLNQWLSGLEQKLASLMNQAESTEKGFLSIAPVSQDIFQSAQGQFPMFLEFWRESSHDPVVWNATIEPYRHYTNLFSKAIQRGIEDGSIKPIDPQRAARVVVALALGVILQGVMDPEGAAWDHVVQDGLQILMRGLRKIEEGDQFKPNRRDR